VSINETLGEQIHRVKECEGVAVRNIISLGMGRKLVKLSESDEYELPENFREEDVLHSVKVSVATVKRKEEELREWREINEEWKEIAEKLGCFDED